ncbi:hypothetical protein E4U42_006501 [Claviceps africana]|uniref:Zn(2)-C6 fungal-type domain-containing protein n=1 Tax=Claviceps africana TaxID=83212 RepID=A0A8K0J298_9HYPO|nr:hypothetical protein E4U42_006501 [Claviceps africana]
MGDRQMQQRDRATPIPQLSCALCRDRKLKCDKLDPCTNCTSSGVTCMPVYRPRLPRGRHARRSPNNSSLKPTTPPQSTNQRCNAADAAASAAGTSRPIDSADNLMVGFDPGSRLGRLEALVQGGDVLQMMDDSFQEANGIPDLMDRVRRLENLVQKIGSCDNSPATGSGRACLEGSCESNACTCACACTGTATGTGTTGGQQSKPSLPGGNINADSLKLANVAPLADASLLSLSSAESEPFAGNDHHYESGCVAHSRHFFLGLMHGDRRRGEHEPSPSTGAYHEDADVDNVSQEDQDGDELRCLKSMGLDNCVGFRPRRPAGFPFGDRSSILQLCDVYLRNVDPVIKILHRPSLSKWMLDGDRYLGYPEDHISTQALEAAVCYAAASTLSEAQCQAMSRISKSTMVSTYRKQCEVAFERAGLLTTRCSIILQSFVLYLVSRRSEEKGTAVWTLVDVAVRIALAMGLNREPRDGTAAESFFHQQMRLRLWLTICLLDSQASLAQSTKPLIGYQDAEAAVSKIRNINDFDFDASTLKQVPDREELTEATFALVTYRAQAAGRLLNLSKTERVDGISNGIGDSDAASPLWTDDRNSQQRRNYVSQFQHQVLVPLRFCDPESSPYAWFTWHSTQCLVSAMPLSEFISCPPNSGVDAPATPSSPSRGRNTNLLRNSLRTLEKSQLIYSDPRGEGFRWYTITTARLALSTAIVECNTCTDSSLVRRAWPIIEASYQQYESFFLESARITIHCPLAMAMNQVREKLSLRLKAGILSEQSLETAFDDAYSSKASSYPFPDAFSGGSLQTPVNKPLGLASYIPEGSSPSSQACPGVSAQPFVQTKCDPDPLSLEYTPELEAGMNNSNMYQLSPFSELFEPCWMVGDMMTADSNWGEEAMVRNDDRDGDSRALYYGSRHIGF